MAGRTASPIHIILKTFHHEDTKSTKVLLGATLNAGKKLFLSGFLKLTGLSFAHNGTLRFYFGLSS